MLPALLGAASLPAGEGNAPPPAQQTPTFVDVAEESGVDLLTLSGTPYKAYIVESTTGGTSVFDYDNDGDVDIYIVNGSRLAGFFFDTSFAAGLGAASFTELGWGAGFFDADNDGDQDLFVANGHVYPSGTTTGWDRATGSAISCSRTAAMACSAT